MDQNTFMQGVQRVMQPLWQADFQAAIRGLVQGSKLVGSNLTGTVPIASLPEGTAGYVLTGNGAGTASSYQPSSSATYGTPALTLGTVNAAGTANAAVRTDATILTFGTAVPVTQAFSDVADPGTGTIAARITHKHGMPANPGAATYGTPALTLGTANAAGTVNAAVRTDATILAFDATNPVTQAFSDAASPGAATVAARRDHVHGMMAAPAGSTSGQELGYTARTSGTTATSATAVDIASMSVTVTVGSRPIVVEFYAYAISNGGVQGARTVIELYDVTASAIVQQAVTYNGVAAGQETTVFLKARLAPSAGSRTYKMRWYAPNGALMTLLGGTTMPPFIRVEEV